MSGPVDVLAVMRADAISAAVERQYDGDAEWRAAASDLAVSAVAELIEAARRAEVAFNTVRGCYERNPGNFALAMRELDGDVEGLRSALANMGEQS